MGASILFISSIYFFQVISMLKIPQKTAQKVRCGANMPFLQDWEESDELARFRKHHVDLLR